MDVTQESCQGEGPSVNAQVSLPNQSPTATKSICQAADGTRKILAWRLDDLDRCPGFALGLRSSGWQEAKRQHAEVGFQTSPRDLRTNGVAPSKRHPRSCCSASISGKDGSLVQAYLRDRWRRQLTRERSHQRLSRHAPRKARPQRSTSEVRPVHQRRPRNHEPLPARRSLRP